MYKRDELENGDLIIHFHNKYQLQPLPHSSGIFSSFFYPKTLGKQGIIRAKSA